MVDPRALTAVDDDGLVAHAAGPDEGLVVDLLATPGDLGVGLATEILFSCIKAVVIGGPVEDQPPLAMFPGPALLRALDRVLSDPAIKMAPIKRQDLRAWLEAAAGS